MALILASASPRRRELLGLLTPDFTVDAVPVDESRFAAPTPAALAGLLAREKCLAAAALHPQDAVLGADTVVEIDGQQLGKPADEADARRMLTALSGRAHLVHTGVYLYTPRTELQRTVTTTVHFAPLSAAELDAYLAGPEPWDKAGAYGIQGQAARFVTGIEGCYHNVVGLPVRAVYEMLCSAGVLPG